MNIQFWAVLIVMLLVAIVALVLPLLRVKTAHSVAYKESNLKINEEKIKELDIDLAEGRINQADYRAAREELDRELLSDIPAESAETAALHYTARAKRSPTMALLVSVFIPMFALLLYFDLGMHAASDESFVSEQTADQPQMSIEEMAAKLEQRIAENGGSVQEWTMLARAQKHLGKYDLAAKAFSVALEQDSENAQLMLEKAEVLAISNDRVFNAEANELIAKAYVLQPNNANVLWFAGVAAFQAQQYQMAIDHLLQLLPSVGNEQDIVRSILSVVAESRDKLIASGVEMPELADMLGIKEGELQSQDSAVVATAGTSLTVNVDIAQEVKDKFAASDSVFVYAKAKQGPRMPLAVQRLTLAALPVTVVLDDSMAMMEGMTMSNFDQLEISARVTKSGSAISQQGDYIGRLDVEDKHTEDALNVMIDTLVQ